MLLSESSSSPVADVLWVGGVAPRYMLLVKMMSVGGKCEVKSGIQIIVIVGHECVESG